MSDTATKEFMASIEAVVNLDPALGSALSYAVANGRVPPTAAVSVAKVLGLLPQGDGNGGGAKGWAVNGLELIQTTFTEPTWLVEGLLPVGLVILAGPPKRGKSWMALEIALAICAGGYFLGRKARQGRVLYCALEDSPRRLKDRLLKQGWTEAALANLDVVFARDFYDALGRNGADAALLLAAQIEASDYALVVIDTVARAFGVRDWNDAALVTAVLGPIQEAAIRTGKCVLAVDHHNKGRGFDADPILDVSGSVEKVGVADTILGLYKENGKPGAKLWVIGKDVDELILHLRFDPLAGCWVEVEPGDGLTDTQRQTIEVIRAFEGGATLGEIVEATGRNKGTIYRELESLCERGVIRKVGQRWQWTGVSNA